METGRVTVLIMAAGTGGHVFPALSIAESLRAQGVDVQWLGTPMGMENDILENTDIPLHRVTVSGLRGAGLKKLLTAPFMIAQAFWQSVKVLRNINPQCVIGMGGFVCGPAGLASKFLGIPLLLHEQNAVAGLTNKLLARVAHKICEAFPGTFPSSSKLVYTGNPIRKEIVDLGTRKEIRDSDKEDGQVNLLVLGGSQGALAINQVIPKVVSELKKDSQVHTWHQTGAKQLESTIGFYSEAGFEPGDDHRVVAFIDDMAKAYEWADLVICRSGASTVSEIAVVGLPAIFIPYPYHKDNQQTHNAEWLSREGAAEILQQSELSEVSLLNRVRPYIDSRQRLAAAGAKGRELAIRDADLRIAELCRELADV